MLKTVEPQPQRASDLPMHDGTLDNKAASPSSEGADLDLELAIVLFLNASDVYLTS